MVHAVARNYVEVHDQSVLLLTTKGKEASFVEARPTADPQLRMTPLPPPYPCLKKKKKISLDQKPLKKTLKIVIRILKNSFSLLMAFVRGKAEGLSYL